MAENKVADQFKSLAGKAESGELIIEQGAAARCAARCEAYIADLQALSFRTQRMVNADSFGDLDSAEKLAAKFATLAEGGPGTGSYLDAATTHIEILTQMAEMYRKAGAAYEACDEATQLAIKQQTNQLD
ncbi:hypothetical protein [Nocardia sp. AG03]|uniref:hypothetical protein n=1 Tax=Nocardia sp. AG03 TaxID=3025312 RepID=UPI0024187EF2|nr:hypothetical protein [Nocardia sp. AG03]